MLAASLPQAMGNVMLWRDEVTVRLLFVLLAMLPGLALAHGTQPAAWQSLRSDGDGPQAIRLSEGVGLRVAPTTWRFVCSARWHGPVSPEMARTVDGVTWVLGQDGVRGLAYTGEAAYWLFRDLPATQAKALAVTDNAAVLLASDATGATLYALPQTTLLWYDPHPWQSMSADADTVWLVAARDNGFDLAHLDAQWHGDVRRIIAPTGEPRVHVSAGKVYVTLHTETEERTGQVVQGVWQELAADPPTLWGPIQVGANVFAAHGGVIRQLQGGQEIVTDASRYFTCIGEDSGGAYACARQDLRRLIPDGTAGEVLFDVAWLTPPSVTGLETPDQTACWTEWSNFAQDAGLHVGTPYVDARGDTDVVSTQCSASHRGQMAAIGLLFLAAGLLRWRRS